MYTAVLIVIEIQTFNLYNRYNYKTLCTDLKSIESPTTLIDTMKSPSFRFETM